MELEHKGRSVEISEGTIAIFQVRKMLAFLQILEMEMRKGRSIHLGCIWDLKGSLENLEPIKEQKLQGKCPPLNFRRYVSPETQQLKCVSGTHTLIGILKWLFQQAAGG